MNDIDNLLLMFEPTHTILVLIHDLWGLSFAYIYSVRTHNPISHSLTMLSALYEAQITSLFGMILLIRDLSRREKTNFQTQSNFCHPPICIYMNMEINAH